VLLSRNLAFILRLLEKFKERKLGRKRTGLAGCLSSYGENWLMMAVFIRRVYISRSDKTGLMGGKMKYESTGPWPLVVREVTTFSRFLHC
jgi:hypothetical protein